MRGSGPGTQTDVTTHTTGRKFNSPALAALGAACWVLSAEAAAAEPAKKERPPVHIPIPCPACSLRPHSCRHTEYTVLNWVELSCLDSISHRPYSFSAVECNGEYILWSKKQDDEESRTSPCQPGALPSSARPGRNGLELT